MKKILICILCLSSVLLFSSCSGQTDIPAQTESSTTFHTEETTTSLAVTTESTSSQAISESTQKPSVTTNSCDDSMPPEKIWKIQMHNIMVVRWGDIIESSRKLHAVHYDYVNQQPIYEIEIVGVKVEIVEILHNPDYIEERFMNPIWVPVSDLDMVVKGEYAIVFPWDFESYHLSVYSPFLMHYHDMSTNIIPIIDGQLHPQKKDSQVWSKEIKELFDFTTWAKEKGVDVPLFEDGMALSDFREMMDYILSYR